MFYQTSCFTFRRGEICLNKQINQFIIACRDCLFLDSVGNFLSDKTRDEIFFGFHRVVRRMKIFDNQFRQIDFQVARIFAARFHRFNFRRR